MTRDNKVERVRSFFTQLPYCKALQLEILGIGDGFAEMALPYREDLVGDPATAVLHGGAVSALMDTTGGAAVMAHPEAGLITATLDLRIDYMRAATPKQKVRARAECFHVARSVAFVRATAFDEDAAHPVATAAGAFTVIRRKVVT